MPSANPEFRSRIGIISSTIASDNDTLFDTPPNFDTIDKVFLLSFTEVDKYFSSDDERICIATKYAINYGVEVGWNGLNHCNWWLRTRGWANSTYAAVVDDNGIVNRGGELVHISKCAIRPAICIDLSK